MKKTARQDIAVVETLNSINFQPSSQIVRRQSSCLVEYVRIHVFIKLKMLKVGTGRISWIRVCKLEN